MELRWSDESRRWNGLGVGVVSPGLLSNTCVRSIGLSKFKIVCDRVYWFFFKCVTWQTLIGGVNQHFYANRMFSLSLNIEGQILQPRLPP